MKKLIPIAAVILSALPGLAASFTIGSFTYTTTSDTTVELSVSDVTEGDIVIPETVTDNGKTYTVTSIGEGVFIWSDIVSVDMPNTITRIGAEAFQFCMGLEKVHLSDNLEVIGASAFQTTRSLTEINWPTTLKSINSTAFLYSTSYSGQIWLPKGISLDDGAFQCMESATSMWINGQPSEWGNAVCEGCNNLTKLYVNCLYPPTFDPTNAFRAEDMGWEDPAVMTLYVPVGAKENYEKDVKWAARFEEIIEMEFTDTDTRNPAGGDEPTPGEREYETYTDSWSEDYTVARLNVPTPGTLPSILGEHKNTVKEISLSGKLNGTDILCLRNMSGCSQDGMRLDGAVLEKIDLTNCEIVEGGEPYYAYLESYFTEQDIVGSHMFSYCYSLKDFAMPKYAESIGTSAFDNAVALASFTFSEYTKSIGKLAFYNCFGLTEIDIPDACENFGDMVFYTCMNLKSVRLPQQLKAIPFATFYFCKSLNGLTLPEGIKRIDNEAFNNCASLETISIPAATNQISSTAFGSCHSLTAINVAEDNAEYADIDGVLFNKNNSKLLIYPEGKQLERYEIPEGTVTVAEDAMSGATFVELVIPEGVVSMMPGSASYCENLRVIEMPSTLTTIEDAFEWDEAITDYFVADGNPMYSDIKGVLCNADGTLLIQYPVGRNDTEYTVPEGIVEIGNNSFDGVAALEILKLSEGVKQIDRGAFAYCENLREVTLPSTLELIQIGSFGYTGLKEVYSNATVPPVCEYSEDEIGLSSPFNGVDVTECKLYVSQDSYDAYAHANIWSDFDIQKILHVTDINQGSSSEVVEVYTIEGIPTTVDAKGILIVRTADGKTHKIVR